MDYLDLFRWVSGHDFVQKQLWLCFFDDLWHSWGAGAFIHVLLDLPVAFDILNHWSWDLGHHVMMMFFLALWPIVIGVVRREIGHFLGFFKFLLKLLALKEDSLL